MLVEIDFFVHKFLLDNCLRIIEKEKKLMITFFVKLHQDVVLEEWITHKSPILLSLIDLQRKNFFTKMFFVVRHLDVVHEDSLVVEEKSLFYKLVDIREWEMPIKFHDDRTKNSWEIEERRFRHNIPCAPSPWCCSWGSSDGRNEFSFI